MAGDEPPNAGAHLALLLEKVLEGVVVADGCRKLQAREASELCALAFEGERRVKGAQLRRELGREQVVPATCHRIPGEATCHQGGSGGDCLLGGQSVGRSWGDRT